MIVLDNVIKHIQKRGGITTWWQSLLKGLGNSDIITHYNPSKGLRYFPVYKKSDLFISSFYRVNLYPGCKNILVVHDVLREKYFKSTRTLIWRLYIQLMVFYVDRLVFISEHTQNSFWEVYRRPKTIKDIVIHHGFEFPEINFSTTTRSDNIIFVGKRGSYKNFLGGLQFISGKKLVIVGPTLSDEEKFFLDKYHISYREAGFLDADDLRLLYLDSSFLYWPSLDEGFGLPPIEAIQHGCIPICIDNAINSEILGEDLLVLNEEWELKAKSVNISEVRDNIKERFSLDRMIDSYKQLFLDEININNGKL